MDVRVPKESGREETRYQGGIGYLLHSVICMNEKKGANEKVLWKNLVAHFSRAESHSLELLRQAGMVVVGLKTPSLFRHVLRMEASNASSRNLEPSWAVGCGKQ